MGMPTMWKTVTITIANGAQTGSSDVTDNTWFGYCRWMEIDVPDLTGTVTVTLSITSPVLSPFSGATIYSRASIAENAETALPIREVDILAGGSATTLQHLAFGGAGYVFTVTKSGTNQTGDATVTVRALLER